MNGKLWGPLQASGVRSSRLCKAKSGSKGEAAPATAEVWEKRSPCQTLGGPWSCRPLSWSKCARKGQPGQSPATWRERQGWQGESRAHWLLKLLVLSEGRQEGPSAPGSVGSQGHRVGGRVQHLPARQDWGGENNVLASRNLWGAIPSYYNFREWPSARDSALEVTSPGEPPVQVFTSARQGPGTNRRLHSRGGVAGTVLFRRRGCLRDGLGFRVACTGSKTLPNANSKR